MNKRVMLIFPPSTSLASWEPMAPVPMGIAYLGASLRQAGFEVALLDAVCEDAYNETPVSETVSRYGMSYEAIMERIEEFDPAVVGLSCIFSNQWTAVASLTRTIKQRMPGVTVIAGGNHPTFLARMCMDDAPLDFILKGEADLTLVDLLSTLENNTPLDDVDGLVWRENGDTRENDKTGYIEDLDSLPFPAHDLLPIEKYYKLALPMAYGFLSPRNMPVVTSRGCPCRCTFCSSTNYWGGHHRSRSAQNVLAEIDWLVEKFGVEEIKFQDDNLTADKRRAQRIFKGLAEKPYKVHWNTPNGIAVWTLDREMLTLMKESGCWAITMAIESGDNHVLKKIINKPVDLNKVREINKICADLDIYRSAYFIIGLPGESRERIQKTIELARELRLMVWAIFAYNPLPGSKLYETCVEKGYINPKNFFVEGNQYFSSPIDSEDWTSQELEEIIRREWIRYYFNVFRFPYPVLRGWYKLLRHRPSFVKFFLLRTLRTAALVAGRKKKLKPESIPDTATAG